MKRILLFDKKNSHSQHISLLLRVADMHCTHAESVEEVLNLLSIDSLKQLKFDLLLLNSWPDLNNHMDLFNQLIADLKIPVIYVSRDSDYLPTLDQRCISICHPENVLGCINTHLRLETRDRNNQTKAACPGANSLANKEPGLRHSCSCFELTKANQNPHIHNYKQADISDPKTEKQPGDKERN